LDFADLRHFGTNIAKTLGSFGQQLDDSFGCVKVTMPGSRRIARICFHAFMNIPFSASPVRHPATLAALRELRTPIPQPTCITVMPDSTQGSTIFSRSWSSGEGDYQ
jgi:hypothetical protein